MKKQLLSALVVLSSVSTWAQNQAPIISNLAASIDTSLKLVTISYDLSDAENDSSVVYFRVSNNNKTTFLVNTSNATGAVGAGIGTGTNKQLVWSYSALTGVSGNYIVQLVADDEHVPSIQELVNKVDTNRLITDMQVVEGIRHYTTGAAQLQKVKDTIVNRFASLGLDTVKQNFAYGTYQGQNLIGKHQGLVSEDSVLIIDGHYDSVNNSPGADDNGSAVLGVLEAAKILSQYNFKKTIRFVGFDLEELGLVGSKEYVKNGIYSYEKVTNVINFEMIGYYSNRKNSQSFPAGFNLLFPAAYNQVAADTFRGNFVNDIANTNSSSLKTAFINNASAFVPSLKVVPIEVAGTGTIAADLRRSDHAPFWDKGIKAIMLSDGANFRNHNYHSSHDVSDSLNYGFMGNNIKASIATLAALAELMHCDKKQVTVNLPNVITAFNNKKNTAESITVTPNPSSADFLISWENISFEVNEIIVLNKLGAIAYKTTHIDASKKNHSIIGELLMAGTYTVKCIGNNGKVLQKTIIKN